MEPVSMTPETFQTAAPEAQAIERRIQRAWFIYERFQHVPSARTRLRRPVGQIVREVRDLAVSYDDWRILNREVLRIEKVVRGGQTSMDDGELRCDEITVVDVRNVGKDRIPDPMELPAGRAPGQLNELLAAPDAKVAMSALLLATAFSAIVVADLAVVVAALTLRHVIPVWAAAVIIGAPFVGIALVAVVVWSRRWERRLERVLHRAAMGLPRAHPFG
jgi:hypothetical protein